MPSHRYGAQVGEPGLPMAMGVHIPWLPLRLHASHSPLQAVSQQRPSTQLFDWHSTGAAQVAPSIFFGTHCESASQKKPFTQSLLLVHVDGQAALVPLHSYGAQLGAPGEPDGTTVQLPSLPTTLHTSQLEPQAESQQNPSAQKLLRHWLGAVQLAPLVCLDTHCSELLQ